MTKLQKIALLNLSLASVCLILQLLRFVAGVSLISLFASIVILALGCVMLVSYFHRRNLMKRGGGEYDERDRSIHTAAALTGLGTAFVVSFLATFLAFLIVGPGGELDIGYVLGMFLLGAMSFFFTESAVVLLKYGWGGEHAEK